jgi:AAHS family 4-hydroxybenzoate transporter-like MFS transporter
VRAYQLGVFALCFLSLLADGFDAQALGYVVPAISRQWGIAPSSFAPAFSAGLVGMAIGALGLGSIADYVGRRRIIVICTAIVGGATRITATSTSPTRSARRTTSSCRAARARSRRCLLDL